MREKIDILDMTPELAAKLAVLSAADGGHNAPLANLAFVRASGEVVGASAILAPTFTFYAKTSLHPRESIELVRACQVRCEKLTPGHLAACCKSSQFFDLMPSLGYRELGPAWFFQFGGQHAA